MSARRLLMSATLVFSLFIFGSYVTAVMTPESPPIHIETEKLFAQYGGLPMWDRGPNPEYRQERRLPPRTYDPYDRGPERFGPPPPRGMDPAEYERRSFCAMHPRECR